MMYTQIPSTTPSAPVSSLIPEAARLFIYADEEMLSYDKRFSCRGIDNLTVIVNRTIGEQPGATIISPILLSLTGIAGQFIALYYLHRTTKPSHNRTVFYILLATLIWTDLIGKLLTTPPAIISYAYGRWVGGMKLCNLHGFLMMLIDQVTHFLVAAMALDRFLCVRHGYFYKSSVTKSRIRLALMGIWIFCILFCMMPLFGLGEYEPQYPGTWCFVNIHVGPHTLWYHRLYTNVFGCINILNVFTILICNIIVIGTLISARMLRSRKLSASAQHTQKIVIMSTQRELEIQMSILLLVITVVFFVSWCPITIRLFLNQIWPHTCKEEHVMDLVAVRLASFNQIIDPWAYIICRKFYHQVFTSKIWMSCRSVVLGRNFSSKRPSNLLCRKGTRNEDSSKYKINESSSSAKRKFSLPTPEKCKIISNFSLIRINETRPRSCEVYEGTEKELMEVTRKYGYNLDKGNIPCIPMGGTNGMKRFNIDKSPAKSKYEPVPSSPISRKQFRTPYNAEEGFCFTNSLTETEIGSRQSDKMLRGRRHSWNSAPSIYKHYRTRSTQTLENI